MSHRHIQIILPGLQRAPLAWLDVACPYLLKLLAVANTYPNPYPHNWDKLAASCKLPGKLPAAALLALLHGRYVPNKAYLLLEPIECKPDLKTVFCLGKQHLGITIEQARQLAEDVSNLLPDGAKLTVLDPDTWLIESTSNIDICTQPLVTAVHQSMHSESLTGPDQRIWQRLQTEIQMVWHTSKINVQRAALALSPINSVWFSGEGGLSETAQSIWQYVWTDDSISEGLATLMQSQCEPVSMFKLPQQKTSWHGLIHMTGLLHYHQQLSWQQRLCEYDATIFQPLWQGLCQGRLNALSIWLGGSADFQVTRQARLRFWRRSKNLAYYV